MKRKKERKIVEEKEEIYHYKNPIVYVYHTSTKNRML